MTGETRKKLGKDFKEGKTNHYEEHYLEFKKEIDGKLMEIIKDKKGNISELKEVK